jgi:cysteine sulfinate desulfinase/cysteine desulfurase-like protein
VLSARDKKIVALVKEHLGSDGHGKFAAKFAALVTGNPAIEEARYQRYGYAAHALTARGATGRILDVATGPATGIKAYLDAGLDPNTIINDALIAAMDVAGNPSSVHAEGRAARALIERARGQVAAALGADGADIIFTSGATEAAALACAGRNLLCAAIEHEAVSAWCAPVLAADRDGQVAVGDPARTALQLANSETGVIQTLPTGLAVCDLTQGFGKVPLAFTWLGCDMGLVSAHKLGGPKGIGALVLRRGLDVEPRLKGGGQEMGRRAGTENLIGIAGYTFSILGA